MNSPFKFLSPYKKKDREIFFGRDEDIELLYDTTFKTDLLLLYGQSGTGKTSLIQCGLSNRFRETDWFELYIRRRDNINGFLHRKIREKARTPIHESAAVGEAIQSLYLDYFRPVYLVFDQFEELFILGTREEQQEFFRTIAHLLGGVNGNGENRISCKIIFVMREEYIAQLYDFEKVVPQLFSHRIRVEPMNLTNVEAVIKGSAKVFDIHLGSAEETVKHIIENNKNQKGTIHLPYLQVYLDRLYREAAGAQGAGAGKALTFTPQLVEKVGKISDVMVTFLDEQTGQIQRRLNAKYPKASDDQVWQVLNQFVTVEGTNLPMSQEGLYSRLPQSREMIDFCLAQLERARILHVSEQYKTYEIAHDALAHRIDEKRSVEEKTLLKVEKLVRDRFANYEDTADLLTERELNRIEPYEEKIKSKLDADEIIFIAKSKKKVSKRRKMIASAAVAVSLIIFFSLFAGWQWKVAKEKTKIAKSNYFASQALLKVKKNPTIALRIAEKAWQLDKNKTVTIHNIYLENRFYKIFKKTRLNTFSAAFSPDSRYILSGSGYKTASLWTIEGKEVLTFKGHEKEITCAAFSPDGKYILTGSMDDTARLWDLKGREIRILKGHITRIISAAFSQDGKSILTHSFKGTVRLWDMKGKNLLTLNDPDSLLTSAAISPCGSYILTGNRDGTARLLDVTGKEIRIFVGHGDEVTSAAFSPDGKYVLTGSKDETARLWSMTGKEIQDFNGHKDEVITVAFSPDGKYVLTGSMDKTARLWDLRGNKLLDFIGHEKEVTSAAVSNDGSYLLTYSPGNTLRLWYIKDIKSRVLEECRAAAGSVTVSPDGNSILTAYRDGTVHLFDLKENKSRDFKVHEEPVTAAAFSPDGKYILTGSEDNSARLWDLKGNPVRGFKHDDDVTSVAFSPKGKYILTGSWDHTARVWRINGNRLQTVTSDNNLISSVSFSPDGRYILLGTEHGIAQLWDLNGNLLQGYPGHTQRITSIAFSPGGNYILTGSLDKTARLWEREGNEILVIRGHTSFVTSAAFSPDGNYILTGSRDRTARLWNRRGNLVQEFKGHDGWVNAAVFSPKGKSIITVSRDKTVRLWEVKMPLEDFLKENRCERFSKEQLNEYYSDN